MSAAPSHNRRREAEDREEFTLWRCAECGHWSHAKKRPISHPRKLWDLWYPEEDGEQPLPEGRRYPLGAQEAAWLELPVVLTYTGGYQTNNPDEEPARSGVKIKCGPFEEYRAELQRPWNEDPKAKDHAARLSAESADDSRFIPTDEERAYVSDPVTEPAGWEVTF